MRTCMFIGPSVPSTESCAAIISLPPASLGSVYRAMRAGYRRIVIVDAYFGHVPSVWHKEILFALVNGIQVWGAGSTGALRAVELEPFGMRGVGTVFRLFRRGILSDDDEVCVTHLPKQYAYTSITYPMINLRCSFRRLRRLHLIDANAEREIIAALKEIYFGHRDENAVRLVLNPYDVSDKGQLWSNFVKHYVDIKKRDVVALLRNLKHSRAKALSKRQTWIFPEHLIGHCSLLKKDDSNAWSRLCQNDSRWLTIPLGVAGAGTFIFLAPERAFHCCRVSQRPRNNPGAVGLITRTRRARGLVARSRAAAIKTIRRCEEESQRWLFWP